MLAGSQTTGYAVRALSCIALGTDRVLGRDIAECTGIPRAYLSKILRNLTEAGLLDSKRGYRGGFQLTRAGYAISVADIIVALKGPEWDQQCLLGSAGCSDERNCPTHDFWVRERSRIRAELDRLNLKDVAEFERRKGTARSCARRPMPRLIRTMRRRRNRQERLVNDTTNG